jgi:flagellar hook-associated protein 3 FlgL
MNVRVTDKMLFDSASLLSGRARDNVEEASQEVSTGVRVQHPWDDPGAAAAVIGQKAHADRMQAIGKLADQASDELNAADDALGQLDNVLNRAQQLATQFANDTYSASERAAAGQEVDGLVAQALTLANTKFGSRYVFGGFKDNAPPFDATGAYQGDSGVRQVEIAPGQYEGVSVPGDSLFGGPSTPGSSDLFATLKNLSTALKTNDVASITGSLESIGQGIDQVLQGRAKTGTAVNVLQTAVSASQVAVQSDTAASAKLTNADVVTSASKLAFAQQALNAALTASAKSFQFSLVDKL